MKRAAATEPSRDASASRAVAKAPAPNRPGVQRAREGTAFVTQGSDSASNRQFLLSLQRSAGNAAVSRALTGATAAAPAQQVSRRPAATAPKKPRKPATPNSYVDLMNGVQDLVEAADNHGTGLPELRFGTRLGD